MTTTMFYRLVWLWILLAAVIFFVLLFISAPYGRHARKNWGVMMPSKLGWMMMELPSLLVFSYFFITGKADKNWYVIFFASLWILHYIHRSLVFPFRIRDKGKMMPVLVAFMAICFNLVNGYINGYYLGNLYALENNYSYYSPLFLVGLLLFFSGLYINLQSDQILISLRKGNGGGYVIPQGGFFRWISCPNYFGEIVEWFGFALLVGSLPAFAFFFWTLANLVPRALKHQKWYKKTFPDYPAGRKAILPFIL